MTDMLASALTAARALITLEKFRGAGGVIDIGGLPVKNWQKLREWLTST